MKVLDQLKAVRAKCLDCHGNSAKGVQYCPADGINSTWCSLWPYRFGFRIPKAKRLYPDFMDPKKMPDGDIPLEDLTQIAAEQPPEGSATDLEARRLAVQRFKGKKGLQPPITPHQSDKIPQTHSGSPK